MFLETSSCIPVCRWLQASYGIPPGCVTEGTLELGHQHIKKGQDRFSRYAGFSLNRPLGWFSLYILMSVCCPSPPQPLHSKIMNNLNFLLNLYSRNVKTRQLPFVMGWCGRGHFCSRLFNLFTIVNLKMVRIVQLRLETLYEVDQSPVCRIFF